MLYYTHLFVYVNRNVLYFSCMSCYNDKRGDKMKLVYKFDVLSALKEAGFSTYRLRKEHIFSEGTIQKFRNGEVVDSKAVLSLCSILHCQPGDLLEYIEE